MQYSRGCISGLVLKSPLRLSDMQPKASGNIVLRTDDHQSANTYSVQFSHSVVSDSLQPHELQHTRLPCPSLSPRVCSNSLSIESMRPSSHLILCYHLLLLPLIFPSIRVFFQMSQLFASAGQSIGVSASTSVLPMNTHD